MNNDLINDLSGLVDELKADVQKMQKAKTMGTVPLAKLDHLIKERQFFALKNDEANVNYFNSLIRYLLGC